MFAASSSPADAVNVLVALAVSEVGLVSVIPLPLVSGLPEDVVG